MGLMRFRVWHKDGKVMLSNYLGFMITDAGQLLIESMIGDEATMEKVELDNYIVMQYTGLKDKNGVEIYGGDIVKWSRLCLDFRLENYEKRSDNFAVEWDVYNTGFVLGDGEVFLYKDISSELEVIGNIYEDPELLEEI